MSQIFRGPGDNGVGPGALFSTYTFADPISPAGARGGVELAIDSLIVGMGNSLLINTYNTFPYTGAPTDVKWVDIVLAFERREARIAGSSSTTFGARYYFNTEVISERDMSLPGTQRLVHRYQTHRVPNMADSDNQHPFSSAAEIADNPSSMVFYDVAADDRLNVFVDLVAVDESATAAPATGSLFLAVASGGFARNL
jgi:hypothetical protein